MTFLGILDVLGGIPTTFGKVILETVRTRMDVSSTNKSFSNVLRPVTNETRETRDYGIVKLVHLGQQLQIDVIVTLIKKL